MKDLPTRRSSPLIATPGQIAETVRSETTPAQAPVSSVTTDHRRPVNRNRSRASDSVCVVLIVTTRMLITSCTRTSVDSVIWAPWSSRLPVSQAPIKSAAGQGSKVPRR